MILVGFFSCSLVFGQAAGGEAAKPIGPKLWLESKTIDLGVIAVDQQQIEGVVRYMNEGDETLEITNINGPCDCFAGFGRILFLHTDVRGTTLPGNSQESLTAGMSTHCDHYKGVVFG